MRHTFQAEQWVPYSRERVFAFFANPANLPPLMPGWQQARLERAHYVPPSAPPIVFKAGLAAGQGSLISISFRPIPLVPIRLAWDALIAEFSWNDSFCDEQQRGPFRYFRHCHRIQADIRESVTGSLVSDAVEYELPMGRLGDLANQVGVKKQMESMFAYRHQMLPVLLAQA
jgi:ligand-binding SRPBCC domain-containing protein